MATGFIPQEIIDEIAASSDIVEIINEYVPLKKKGRNYQGLCPFHHEKTPSFSVSPEKQIYHCFGCGVGGNVFSFLMQMEGLNFPEALNKLAQRAGIALPAQEMSEAEKKQLKQKERWYKINEAAAQFFHQLLVNSHWGKNALEYLKARGIKQETIRRFQLGFALPRWDDLLKFMQKKGVKAGELHKLGLVLPKNSGSGFYDRFRSRLMFPIWDTQGRVIAFGGRVIDGGEPKYLNSPDTPLFHKGQYLYGLHLAKSTMRSEDLAVIVEGYMDVIACHQYGVTNAVASLGTAFTQDQARNLMRHTYRAAIAYDADTAGSNAAIRGLDILSDLGCQVTVINLPQGMDPDEYVRKYGKDSFQGLVNRGQSLIECKLAKVMENVNITSIEGKFKIVQGILPDLYKIDSPVARDSSIKLISKKLGLAEESILGELRKYSREKYKVKANKDRNLEKRENNNINIAELNNVEIQMLKALFEHQEYFKDVEEAGGEELFTFPLRKLYQEMIGKYQAKGKITGADLDQEESKLLAAVLISDFQMTDIPKAVADYIKNLQVNKLNQDYSRTIRELSKAETAGDSEQVKKLLSHMELLLQQKKLLAP
ncbi:MAG: DNA primase [Peptococcaceae bacterium]